MGFHIAWIAVPLATAEQLLQQAALTHSDEWFEFPEPVFCGRALDSGWYLLQCSDVTHHLLQPASLQRLSTDTELLLCVVEETSMTFSLARWHNSLPQWTVCHCGHYGNDHLQTEGALPKDYAAIARRCIGEAQLPDNQDVDTYSEIPLQLGKQLIGYRHDECDEDGSANYELLLESRVRQPETVKRPWYRLW